MRRDAEFNQKIFFWEGAVDRQHLEDLLNKQNWSLPDDLFNLLCSTGGGDIFESETILGPFRDEYLGENLFGYNQELQSRGFPEGYVAFHTGIALSAVRLSDGHYVEFGLDDFQIHAEYDSLEDWYRLLIRAEFAMRYRLPINPKI